MKACRTNDIENALRPLIKTELKTYLVLVVLYWLKVLLIAVPVIIALIPLVKDLVYYFFAARQRVSVCFDIRQTC